MCLHLSYLWWDTDFCSFLHRIVFWSWLGEQEACDYFHLDLPFIGTIVCCLKASVGISPFVYISSCTALEVWGQKSQGRLRALSSPQWYKIHQNSITCLSWALLWGWPQWFLAAATKSLQSCLTLCNPIDGSPPGSPVPGLPFPSPVHESEKWKWRRSVVSDS